MSEDSYRRSNGSAEEATQPTFDTPQSNHAGQVAVWQSRARGYLTVLPGPALIVAASVTMLAWTWGTWPDVLIDFGRERYIPWRLAQGEVLYRDIAFYNGPLSQYFNALWFYLFGASFRTLVFCNLVLLAGLMALLYYAMSKIASRWVAQGRLSDFSTAICFCPACRGWQLQLRLPLLPRDDARAATRAAGRTLPPGQRIDAACRFAA